MSQNPFISPEFRLRTMLPGHDDWVNRLKWSPDGTILASTSEDRLIRLWDFKTGGLLTEFSNPDGTGTLEWSPDGRFLLCTAWLHQDAQIWDIKKNKLHAKLEGLRSIDLAYSPNGAYLASYNGSEIIILNAQTFALMHSIPLYTVKKTIVTNPIRWSYSGEYIAVGSEENIIKIYRTDDWGLYRTLNIGDVSIDNKNPIINRYHLPPNTNDLLWMPDNNTLLVASGAEYPEQNTIGVWDIESVKLITELKDHTASIRSLRLTLDKTVIASKANDYYVRFWRCSDWKLIATLPVMALGYGIDFHPRLPVLALPYAEQEDWDFRIALWEVGF